MGTGGGVGMWGHGGTVSGPIERVDVSIVYMYWVGS